MKFLREIQNLDGVTVLLRVDFNVPIKDGIIVDDFRIRKVIPTIEYLQKRKAKIVLISHLEDNKKVQERPSLEPVCHDLRRRGIECVFIKNYRDVLVKLENVLPGGVVLLENLRMYEGESQNDIKFARELASFADIYVNEAFAVSHRKHASLSAITTCMSSYGGLLLEQEIKHLSSAFNPTHPFLFIIGGAKFETKLPLIEKFIESTDKIFVGGALANNFFKEMGQDIGTSLISPDNYRLERFIGDPKLILPIDHVKSGTAIFDVGPETVDILRHHILNAKYILWNGPLGAYEMGYKESTLSIAQTLVEATKKGATTILGGGDTLAAIAELGTEEQYTFVSTGGGAMLEYLVHGTLPALEALDQSLV